MAKLYEELNKYTFDEFEIYNYYNADLIIKNYVKQGHKLNANNINRIIYKNGCAWIYILLIKHGYVFKNNLYLIEFLSLLNINLPKDYKTIDKKTRASDIRYEFINILEHPELQRILKLPEIILTDKDIDKAISLFKDDTMLKIGNIIDYYYEDCLSTKNNQLELPKLIFKLKKYRFENRKIYKIL